MKKVNKTKNSTFKSSSAWCLNTRPSSQLKQGLAVNKPWNVESLESMSLATREPGALHKANLIKINKINNILLSDNSFNAKMDSVHYDSNKLIIENSKFLNKYRDATNSVDNKKKISEKIKNSNNSAPMSRQRPAQQSFISLKDTSLSLISNLSKGIGTIAEIIKPNKTLFNLNQGKYTSNQINLSNSPSLSKGIVSRAPFPHLSSKNSIENISAGAVPSESRDLASNKQNQNKAISVFSLRKGENGNNFNIFDFISSYLSRPEGQSIAITMAKAQSARAAIKMETEGSVDGTQVIDVAYAADNKTKDTTLKKNIKDPLAKGKLDLFLLNQPKESTASNSSKGAKAKAKETLAPMVKVEPASLNKIKSSSTITQKVYDYILDNKELSNYNNKANISIGPKGAKDTFRLARLGLGAKRGSALREEKKTIIHKYLSNITKSNSHININPNLSKKFGILLNYNRSLGYTFLNKIYCLSKHTNNPKLNQEKELKLNLPPLPNKRAISEYISLEDIYKLLYYFFKSIYCIISKPTILFSPDKITIRLFYYLVIPKKKVLKLFTIYNLKEKREEWKLNKLKYNIIRKAKQQALLSPATQLKIGAKSLSHNSDKTLQALRLLRETADINYYKNKWKSNLNLLSPLLSPAKSPAIAKGGFGAKALEIGGEGISTADSNNSALTPINTENKWLALDKSSAAYAKNYKFYNINKIRLPFMKYKVKKVISRLKSKSPIIRDLYIDLREFNIVKVFHNKFLLLTKILSTLFKKPVVLEITRIHNFKYDSNILANLIQFVVKNKRKKPRIAINKVYRKKNIKLLNDPNLASRDARNKVITFLSGLNIYINGRLMREPIIPRISTKKFEKGASARGKVNYIDTSYITKKNRKGAYTIKVKSAQNFL